MMTLTLILHEFRQRQSITTTLFSRSVYPSLMLKYSNNYIQCAISEHMTSDRTTRRKIGGVTFSLNNHSAIIFFYQPGLHVEVDESLFGKVHISYSCFLDNWYRPLLEKIQSRQNYRPPKSMGKIFTLICIHYSCAHITSQVFGGVCRETSTYITPVFSILFKFTFTKRKVSSSIVQTTNAPRESFIA